MSYAHPREEKGMIGITILIVGICVAMIIHDGLFRISEAITKLKGKK